MKSLWDDLRIVENNTIMEGLKDATRYTKDTCRIVDGKCRRYRANERRGLHQVYDIVKDGTCCTECVLNRGFYKENDVLTEEQLEFMKANWNPRWGFHTNSGCILPRKWRSCICNTYVCKDEIHKEMKFKGDKRT